jgi:hypothetical protein
VSSDSRTAVGDDGSDRPRWRLVESDALLGHAHAGRGRLDESDRRLGHEELAVAALLRDEGHEVRALRERRGVGPVADLSVCGTKVEVKSWLPLAERNGRIPDSRSVFNKLRSASRQADVVVLNGQGSGITPAAARHGMMLYGERASSRAVTTVRVLGDDFDLTWMRGRGLEREAAREREGPSREATKPRTAEPPEIGL